MGIKMIARKIILIGLSGYFKNQKLGFPRFPPGMELALPGIRSKNQRGVSMGMSKEAVRDKMMDGNVVVLNVLPESDYAKLHIKGSDNLPMGLKDDDFVQAVEKKYGKDKFFITYCAGLTCNAGPNAAKALQRKGFKANDFKGGTEEWSNAGYPTEGTEAQAPLAAHAAAN